MSGSGRAPVVTTFDPWEEENRIEAEREANRKCRCHPWGATWNPPSVFSPAPRYFCAEDDCRNARYRKAK